MQMETGYLLFQAAGWAADTSWQLARRACSRERGEGEEGGQIWKDMMAVISDGGVSTAKGQASQSWR